MLSGQIDGAVPTKVSVPQTKIFDERVSIGPCPMFGVETVILRRPSLTPLPDCEYSITPLEPSMVNGFLDAVISGNKSQLVPPPKHEHVEALVSVHCA